jgi:hypothetical protein
MAPKKPKPTGKATSASTARTKKEDDARIAGFAKSRNEQARGYSQMGKIVLGNAAAGAVLGKAANYLGAKAGTRVTEAAFKASTKGFGASGAGGKVKNVMTPMGKTLGSTSIGSSAQQSARMGNLETAKIKEAVSAGSDIGKQVIRGVNKAGKVVRATTIAGIGVKGVASKVKKNTKK